MNFTNIFQALIDFFRRKNIDYALIGAFALKAYGYLRATQDVDFLVRYEDQKRITAQVESWGYETIHCSEGFSHHLHPITKLGRIDFVYVKGDTADTILSETKLSLVLDAVRLPVVSPEHLVALKVFAMKNDPARVYREMADIAYLLSLPGIDREEIRKYFDSYGQLEKFYELTKPKEI
jgi:hypothetical protein